jgi:hypothetical protein
MSYHYDRKQSHKKCNCISSFIGLFFGCFILGVYISKFTVSNDNNSSSISTIDTSIYNHNINIIETMINNKSLLSNMCNISNVIYPITPPYSCSKYKSKYWDRCRCGDNCTSFSPKITIYVNLLNNSKTINNSNKVLNFLDLNLDFNMIFNNTYVNKKCPEEKFSIEYFEKIIEKLRNSSSLINTTIKCLYNINNNLIYDDQIVYNKTKNSTIVPIPNDIDEDSKNIGDLLQYPFAIILMICIISCLCCFICACRNLCK